MHEQSKKTINWGTTGDKAGKMGGARALETWGEQR